MTWKCYLWYPKKPISGFDIEKLAAKANILKFQFNFALFYFSQIDGKLQWQGRQQPRSLNRGLQATNVFPLADQTIRLGQKLKTRFRMLASLEHWNRTIKQTYALNSVVWRVTNPKQSRSKLYPQGVSSNAKLRICDRSK